MIVVLVIYLSTTLLQVPFVGQILAATCDYTESMDASEKHTHHPPPKGRYSLRTLSATVVTPNSARIGSKPALPRTRHASTTHPDYFYTINTINTHPDYYYTINTINSTVARPAQIVTFVISHFQT